MNSSTPSSSLSVGTDHVSSPPTPNGSRLVATTFSPGAADKRAFVSPAADSTRCSQLSSTRRTSRGDRKRLTALAQALPGPGSLSPRVVPNWSQTNRPSARGEKSMNQAPSGNWWATSDASFNASRVLPAPPGPIRVSSRPSASKAAALASSASRPTKRVSGVGSVDKFGLSVEPESPTFEKTRQPKNQPGSASRSPIWSMFTAVLRRMLHMSKEMLTTRRMMLRAGGS